MGSGRCKASLHSGLGVRTQEEERPRGGLEGGGPTASGCPGQREFLGHGTCSLTPEKIHCKEEQLVTVEGGQGQAVGEPRRGAWGSLIMVWASAQQHNIRGGGGAVVRNADAQAPLQTSSIRICIFIRSPGRS